MDRLAKDIGIPLRNIIPSASPNLFTVIVHSCWLQKWLKNKDIDNTLNNVNFPIEPSEKVPYPWKKIFVRVLNKRVAKVLPLPRYKLMEGNSETGLTFAQLLHYVSQTNQRNLWKEAYKKYGQNLDQNKANAIVNLVEHDHLLSEVILRLYSCNIIRIKHDSTGKLAEYKEIIPNKYVSKCYETHVNLQSALFTLETDDNFYIVYQGSCDNSLLDCLNFSPSLLDKNYTNGLFVIYQLLNVSKALNDRGLSLGVLTVEDIYLDENLWVQVLPGITNNIEILDSSLIIEHSKSKPSYSQKQTDETLSRDELVEFEKLCMLWVRGLISNLDYLLHLNVLAGRKPNDPQAHFIVPWVTDFASRCGRNWRDLSKSKYRLTKGDRQLEMTYDVAHCPGQVAHHVTDTLSDITCYVYLARRTPKETLCAHVRNKWVPAEYPASIQRMQEWTPDECIPEFYTDPTVFKSIHEDLPDLGIPTWASCVEDFVTKHREALESSHVSDHLHHWIDLTFGYKLSGPASVKCKNVCLSLVDGHCGVRRGAAVQLLPAPHPARAPAPRRISYTIHMRHRKPTKSNDSSEEVSEEEDSVVLPHHVSRLSVPSNRVRARHKSTSRARSLSKSQGHDEGRTSETRASSHTRHYRVQKSELGKGVIYLPKEFNPVASIQTIENIDTFRTKCFFSKAEDIDRNKTESINMYQIQQSSDKCNENSFTNHMFLASYEQNYLRRFSPDALEVLKDRKNRSFNARYTTDASVYKQFVTENRRQDMTVLGCLIVEIFLYPQVRPLKNSTFIDRCNSCRTVLKYNFNSLPKCVSYIASLLLDVQPPSLSFKNNIVEDKETFKKIVVTDKGLPPPTPAQLLQPLLTQHLIPFPKTFNTLYKLLSTLHEYELTSKELNLLYMYDCDGTSCDKYQSIDKTKLYFSQKIAEGKILACSTHLDSILSQIDCHTQFDVLDIFLTHYIDLLRKKETSVLAAWYLFDTISKSIGPEKTRQKLLKPILNLYEDDDFVVDKMTDSDTGSLTASKQKFVKLYHNIFLLQLMVRLGLQCFLDNFTQHLVEAVGGYKDAAPELASPGHICRNRAMSFKKPRYSDDSVKNALSTTNTDIFSPDTSYGSEQIVTPNVEKMTSEASDVSKDKDLDNRSENELFHFETEKERLPSRSSRSKSPVGSIDSYTLSTGQPEPNLPNTPSSDVTSPQGPKELSPSHHHFGIDEELKSEANEKREEVTSPGTSKSMFTSYFHFGEETSADVEYRKDQKPLTLFPENDDFYQNTSCKISDMSCESLIWLAHKLGPVLTCRYITRNLLKMLTLCYIGKDNLMPCEAAEGDEFDAISITNSRLVGDESAAKVIKCLTSIVGMYGSQLVVFQYLPHCAELLACCRRRLSAPLEGGAVASLQLLRPLLPRLPDRALMHVLQDTLLKGILHPALRLLSSTRCTFPSGWVARAALARKLLDALYVLAVRIGPEMTRRHLCVPALQRFFLIFDKASGKTDNWPTQEGETASESKSSISSVAGSPVPAPFLELCRDGSTAQWAVRDGHVTRHPAPTDPPASPPSNIHTPAQEELECVFTGWLARAAWQAFSRVAGADALRSALTNAAAVAALAHSAPTTSPPQPIRTRTLSNTNEDSRTFDSVADHMASSNSFGSNVRLVGNRIEVASEADDRVDEFSVVAHKPINSTDNRHLRGDWLIYWEHEIGRPDKENRFNLKQIKLQTFVGHTQPVKSIHCLDNETSFMSGSKDKTVKLWALTNQGDGNATTQCKWTYTGHKKGVLSLTFLSGPRLAVSTDSVVHVWDPFIEATVMQLEWLKSPISVVRALAGSGAALAAATDSAIKVIDLRAKQQALDVKVPGAAGSLIRCVCTAPSLSRVAVGLASGHVAALDLRTGRVLAAHKPHDAEVLRITAVDDDRILSTGLDQTTVLWRASDGEMLAHLKGPTEPVHCLSVFHDELITGTTNNRIGVHTALHQDASFSSTKLRSDTFKGVLTCMSVLPMNRLLLLGSDNGSISLLC